MKKKKKMRERKMSAKLHVTLDVIHSNQSLLCVGGGYHSSSKQTAPNQLRHIHPDCQKIFGGNSCAHFGGEMSTRVCIETRKTQCLFTQKYKFNKKKFFKS